MKNKYTERDISLFYERFKHLPEYFEIEEVQQLINNPNAKATHLVKLSYKPLKFIIMTSAFILGLSILMLWLTFDKKNKNIALYDNNIIQTVDKKLVADIVLKDTSVEDAANCSDTKIVTKNERSNNLIADESRSVIEKPKKEIKENIAFEKSDEKNKNCNWPFDTVLDKENLFVHLTDDELEKIGIFRKDEKFHYHNKTPNGPYNMEITSNTPEDERDTTYNEYFVQAVSNIACEPRGLGSSNFYSVAETLVPVITNNCWNDIFWFTPHKDFFKALPDRYDYLRDTYENLICLKKKSPQKNFVNYWGNANSNLTDGIYILKLTKEELQRIGIEFNSECVIITDKKKINHIDLCTSGTSITGKTSAFEFPPNPFPLVITDTIGRRKYIREFPFKQDSVNDKKYLESNLNLLIPIKLDVKKLISESKNKQVLILWYYPTEELIDSLPENIKSVIKSEYESIVKGIESKVTSCTYFEVCKSTLILNDLKVYPNPASLSTTIEFNSPMKIVGEISLVNISGNHIKLLKPKSEFKTGNNSFSINLSGINPGIYIISINTNKGFKTQRLIVSHK
jgi:hypothetical protein